jgi:hypothetical protein
MDDQRFPTVSNVGGCLTGRGSTGKGNMSRMARLPSYQRVLIVIYRSFHREPDGSDLRFCCQLHVSVRKEQEFSLSTRTSAPDCNACSGCNRTPVDHVFPASDRSRLVDQIDDDLLNLISVHENLKDRVFEFVLDRSRPSAGILLQGPPRTEVELGYTFSVPVINLALADLMSGT